MGLVVYNSRFSAGFSSPADDDIRLIALGRADGIEAQLVQRHAVAAGQRPDDIEMVLS